MTSCAFSFINLINRLRLPDIFVWYFAEEISNLFSQHNYVVVGLYNQSKNEILDKIKELACKEDSTRLICFLSSHGDETSLACPIKNPSSTYGNITDVTSKAVPMTACEEKSVQIIDVLRCANTTQLINSPKIFFIDACRKYYNLKYL